MYVKEPHVHVYIQYCMAGNIDRNNIWQTFHFPNFLKIGGF